jgi:hypothetical protein
MKGLHVNMKFFKIVALLLLIGGSLQTNSYAQTRSRNSIPAGQSLLASLPDSDAVAQVSVKRLLNDVMPRLLAGNPTKLAQANADIEDFKTRTGIDPRAFDQIALGVRYSYPSDGITKLQTIGLARGSFSAGAMVAAGRVAANGKYHEEKYKGKTIYVFTLDQQVRLLGLFSFRVRQLAASPIDANTLAIGDAESIRRMIDVGVGRGRQNAELITLAARDPNAIIGFGSNVSPSLLKNLDIGNAAIASDLSAVRQVYGAVGTTERDVELFIGARTLNSDAARNLGDTLEGLKQFGALFLTRLSGVKGTLAKSALTNLKIATQANELQIRTAVAQADIGLLMGR